MFEQRSTQSASSVFASLSSPNSNLRGYFLFELLIIIFIEYAFECHDAYMFRVYVIISCTDRSSSQLNTTRQYVQTDRCRSRLWGKFMKENCLKISHHLRKRSTRPKECLQINMVVTVGQQLRQSAGADVAIYHRIRYTIPQYTIYVL